MSNSQTTARTRELGARLRAAREAKGVSNNQLADDLGWSQGTTCRFELGRRDVTALNVATFLGYCGVPLAERAAILELAEEPRDGCWARPHRGLLPDAVPSVLFQYQLASAITCYDPTGIPPLVQTTDFIEADLHHRLPGDEPTLAQCLGARLDYREILIKPNRPTTVCFLHETALRGLPVDEETRWSQYVNLSLATGSGEAQIRIIPTHHDHTTDTGGFALLRFPHDSPLVCRPAETVTLILEGDDHIRRYEQIITDLDTIALSDLDSRNLITELAADAEQHTPSPCGAVADVADDTGNAITR